MEFLLPRIPEFPHSKYWGYQKNMSFFTFLVYTYTLNVFKFKNHSHFSEPETTTTNIPPLFLRPGLSYHGKTASTRIANIAATVAVLVSIDNWTRFPLIEPKTHLKCGKILGDVPSTIHPGTSEMVVFEKGVCKNYLLFKNLNDTNINSTFFQPGFTGVCAVLTYLLEMPPELEYDYSEEPNENKPSYVQVMMSVPYNLNSYHAYLAVGIDNMYLNSTGIFDQIYYYTGPFERAQAGSLVEYTSEDGKGIYTSYFLLLNDDILTRKPSEKKAIIQFFH